MRQVARRKFIGVFLNPYFVQDEGVSQVMDRLVEMGATAVVTRPRVGVQVSADRGVRFPPLHADGHGRVLARPLWGQRELNIVDFMPYQPNLDLFRHTPYKPSAAECPPELDCTVPAQIIAAAHERGMEAHLHVAPFFPGRLRAEDVPVFADGTRALTGRFSDNACLNSDAVVDYGLASVADLIDNYPEVDGLMPDWVEYGAYRVEDVFTCFCSSCQKVALGAGFDWAVMVRDAGVAWRRLHSLTNEDLAKATAAGSRLLDDVIEYLPGIAELVRFKAFSTRRFYRAMRQLVDAKRGPETIITARGWPPPWNMASGLDYAELGKLCQVAAPKIFTFDYSAIPRWYGERLRQWSPEISERAVLDMLVELLDLPDRNVDRQFADYQIPTPEQQHPAEISSHLARMQKVGTTLEGRASLRPFTHAYLPVDQWTQLMAGLRSLDLDGIWIQMYGYLSDDKMRVVADHWT